MGGVILASGLSQRFGPRNKLLVPLRGTPIVVHTAQAYVEAGLRPVIVVVGHDAEGVKAALSPLPVIAVHNPDFAQGQSRSLVHGVHALPASCPAAVIGVADQPFLSSGVIQRLVEMWQQSCSPLIVPRYDGRRGNPVLFDRILFPELLAVTGDQGGRPVVERHRAQVLWIEVPDARPGVDIDTAEDYAAWARRE